MARTEMVKHDTKLKDAERKIQILRESLRILEQKQNDDLVNQYFTQSDTGTAPTASTTGSTSSSSNRSPTCHCCWSGPCPRLAKSACGNRAFHAGSERCLASPTWTLPCTVYQRP